MADGECVGVYIFPNFKGTSPMNEDGKKSREKESAERATGRVMKNRYPYDEPDKWPDCCPSIKTIGFFSGHHPALKHNAL
jgi:hypothetical protein